MRFPREANPANNAPWVLPAGVPGMSLTSLGVFDMAPYSMRAWPAGTTRLYPASARCGRCRLRHRVDVGYMSRDPRPWRIFLFLSARLRQDTVGAERAHADGLPFHYCTWHSNAGGLALDFDFIRDQMLRAGQDVACSGFMLYESAGMLRIEPGRIGPCLDFLGDMFRSTVEQIGRVRSSPES